MIPLRLSLVRTLRPLNKNPTFEVRVRDPSLPGAKGFRLRKSSPRHCAPRWGAGEGGNFFNVQLAPHSPRAPFNLRHVNTNCCHQFSGPKLGCPPDFYSRLPVLRDSHASDVEFLLNEYC